MEVRSEPPGLPSGVRPRGVDEPYLRIGDREYTGEQALELYRLLREALERLDHWQERPWIWDLTHRIWVDFYGNVE